MEKSPGSSELQEEKSLRITIRVPNRSTTGRRHGKRRIEESVTETESEELSSLNDIEEDEAIALEEESVGTNDSEGLNKVYEERSNELIGDKMKLTKRQRAKMDDEVTEFVQLPETIKRRHAHLTEEELALKRNELARRRKNLSEQKLEEEKMETIHKLLNKQATHKYKRMKAEDVEGISEDEKNVSLLSSPVMSRWLDTKNGTVLAIPKKWFNTCVSSYLFPQKAVPFSFSKPCCASCGGSGIYTVMGSNIPQRACSIPCIRKIQSELLS